MEPILAFAGKYGFLSNFAEAPVFLDGEVYWTVEHAFQAAKSLDPVVRRHVQLQETPGEAKREGRRVALRADWEVVKEDVMLYLLQQKFSQEPFRRRLLATGDAHLEEGNPWGDRYWGVCPVGSGKGQNRLGVLLMQVRDELRRQL